MDCQEELSMAESKELIHYQNELAKSGQHVYGLICLNSPSSELKRKVKQDSQMRLFEYSISYTEI